MTIKVRILKSLVDNFGKRYEKVKMYVFLIKSAVVKVVLLSRSAHANNQFYETQIFVDLLFEYFYQIK